MQIEAQRTRSGNAGFASVQYLPTTIFKSVGRGCDFQNEAKTGRAQLTSVSDDSDYRDPNP